MGRLAYRLLGALLIALIVLPVASTSSPVQIYESSKILAFIDPELMDPATYAEPAIIDAPEEYLQSRYELMTFALSKAKRIREGQVKAVISAAPDIDVQKIASSVKRVIAVARLPSFTYIEAWVTKEDVERLARISGIFAISAYRVPLSSVLYAQQQSRIAMELDGSAAEEPMTHKAIEITGAQRVHREYGITGRNVIVAVVDTGVDFGSPGLGSRAIARTPEGVPLIFDSDQTGLVLTLHAARRDDQGRIPLPAAGVTYYDGYYYAIGRTTSMWLHYTSPAGRTFRVEVPLTSYGVGNIPSASGVYRFGLAIQFHSVSGFGTLYTSIPVLYVDSTTPGVYDTVYADLSTLYYLLLRAMNATGVIRAPPDSAVRPLFDLSFADEAPTRYGREVLARDFDGDGVPDVSIGALAGYLYDFLGIFTGSLTDYSWFTGYDYVGTILPGMDRRGLYVTIAYDYNGHGTSVANTIASRLNVSVDLGYGRYPLIGMAPDALLAANTGLLNPIAAQFFFSGFDLVKVSLEPYAIWEWRYTGRHAADIISNSWGSSFVLLAGFGSGFTNYAQIWDYLISTSGTIIVHAGGNGAPGYGTVTTPGDSAFAITLGASTLFQYRPAYGFLPGTYHDVVSWSARGPTNAGFAKPDVVNVGSFEWAFTHTLAGLGRGIGAITLFSGTSQATPMTSGAIALLVSYLKSRNMSYDPGFIKSVVKSTAVDMGYDAYSQGAGHVDIYAAIRAIHQGGAVIASSTSLAENLYSLFGTTPYYAVPNLVADTQLYPGVMKPGSSKTLELLLRNFGKSGIRVNFSAVTFQTTKEGLTKYLNFSGGYAVVGGAIRPLSDVVTEIGENHIKVKLVRGLSRLVIPISMSAFAGADVVEISAFVPYRQFDPLGRAGSYSEFIYPGIELHYGIDVDNNGIITIGETQRINYDIRRANVLHMMIGKPAQKFALAEQIASEYLGRDVTALRRAPLLDLRILSTRYVDVEVTFNLVLERHVRVPWTWISAPCCATVAGEGSASVKIDIRVPAGTAPGLYEGYLIGRYPGGQLLVPISVPVAAVIAPGSSGLYLGEAQSHSYDNYAVSGQFDWGWRYESSDWRSFPIIVEDPNVVGYAVSVRWRSINTSMDVALVGLGPSLLAYPPYTIFYGSVYAAKLSWPPYYPRHAIHGFHDSPIPTMTTVFAPDYSYVLSRLYNMSRMPAWLVVKNTIADASSAASYPERFSILITPVRVSAPEAISASAGARVTAEIRACGYELSFANVFAFFSTPEADMPAEVTPSSLGYSRCHTIRVSGAPRESSLLLVYLTLQMPQLSLGNVFRGAYNEIVREPGEIVIPIVVNVS